MAGAFCTWHEMQGVVVRCHRFGFQTHAWQSCCMTKPALWLHGGQIQVPQLVVPAPLEDAKASAVMRRFLFIVMCCLTDAAAWAQKQLNSSTTSDCGNSGPSWCATGNGRARMAVRNIRSSCPFATPKYGLAHINDCT